MNLIYISCLHISHSAQLLGHKIKIITNRNQGKKTQKRFQPIAQMKLGLRKQGVSIWWWDGGLIAAWLDWRPLLQLLLLNPAPPNWLHWGSAAAAAAVGLPWPSPWPLAGPSWSASTSSAGSGTRSSPAFRTTSVRWPPRIAWADLDTCSAWTASPAPGVAGTWRRFEVSGFCPESHDADRRPVPGFDGAAFQRGPGTRIAAVRAWNYDP